jgi:hypothetical protein
MADLPEHERFLHIAAEPGAGSTTLALQLVHSGLESDGRVLWIGRDMPHPDRLSTVFADIPVTALSRFHAGSFGEHIGRGLEESIELILGLDSLTHIVIDDWAGRSGRADSHVSRMLTRVLEICNEETVVIVTSALYADASGQDEWAMRSGCNINEIWRLTRQSISNDKRNLVTSRQTYTLQLRDGVFEIQDYSS